MTRLRSLLAITTALLVITLANPASAERSSKLRVEDGLAFTLGASSSSSEPLTFLASTESEVKDIEVVVEAISGPDGKQLASPVGITSARAGSR
jgi:hypothetical protein